MKTYIELENMKFFAFHGVMEQEKNIGNEYIVSLKIKVDFLGALDSDDLNCTINYAEIYEVIKKEILIPSDLIEPLAGRILKAVYTKWRDIEKINLKLSKLNPPIPGEIEKASVIIKWES